MPPQRVAAFKLLHRRHDASVLLAARRTGARGGAFGGGRPQLGGGAYPLVAQAFRSAKSLAGLAVQYGLDERARLGGS
eukprot:2897955-Prymnesium_polylepis.1